MRIVRWWVGVGLVIGGAACAARAVAPQSGDPGAVQFMREATAPDEPLSLWYRRPAADHAPAPAPTSAAPGPDAEWVRALPIGNGRLGAMVFGGVVHERLQLNENTLWAGGPYDPVNPDARGALPEVRRLIASRQYMEAARLVTDKVLARPGRQMPYEPLGDLWLTFAPVAAVEEYRRDLNLDTAIATTTYLNDGVRYTREMFASPIDRAIVIRLSSSRAGRLSFTAAMTTPQRASVTIAGTNELVLTGVNGDGPATGADAGRLKGALKFQARLRLLAVGGRVAARGETLAVSGADSVTLLLTAATSYKRFDDVSGDPDLLTRGAMTSAAARSFAEVRAAHVAEHRRLFRRVALDLGGGRTSSRPTDERIRDFAAGGDPQLAVLYFQFARYLLISSSRAGGQPATLQGLWNDSMKPPWESKYTININTEMNYWPADAVNLAECVEPLAAMIRDLSTTGARTAREMYGANGWVAHHGTDLWRATAPVDQAASGMWPLGGAWLALHLWDHYEYTRDRQFLAASYPALKGAAEFFLDTLIEEPVHRWLITSPSVSPENRHPFGTSLAQGPAMDEELLRDLFADATQAAEVLGVDEPFRARALAARARLAPPQIGQAGQLQEWLDDWDLQAPDLHHRHVSHLYALFPGHQITLRDTPALAAAARRSLEIRGDQATGWATAWRVNLWAHLDEGDHAYEILKFLLSPERTYPDMFDAHPPFQIDGNFGGASAIVEMLMQSHAANGGPPDEIELLPALPRAWPAGSVTGLRARGGFEVDLAWAGGRLTSAVVRSLRGGSVRLRLGTITRDLTLAAGSTARWNGRPQ